MKTAFFIACILCISRLFAQTSGITISNDFNLMSNYSSGASTGYNVIPTYNPAEIKGNPYFSEDWLKGSVTTIDNQTFSADLLFMYNKYNNELYYKKSNSDTTLKIDLSRVSSFTLTSDAPHIFMRAELFDKKLAGNFFETLVYAEKKYSFLKLNKTILKDPPYSEVAQMAGGNNNKAKSFADENTYYVYKNDTLTQVELKKKSFIKAMAADAAIEKYLKENNGSFNEKYVTELFINLNELQ